MTRILRPAALALAAGLFFPACALLSKNEPLVPRYFSLEPPPAQESAAVPPPNLALRLGPVTSGSEIRQNLVVRSSGEELSYSEDQRWTEKPEAYLRRALSHELFEERGARRVVSGPSLTVEVELIAFEEVRVPAGAVARVRATMILHDERLVRIEKTLSVDVPVEHANQPDHADETVRALGVALDRVVRNIADEVCKEPGPVAQAP